jgi:tRNA A-37 threonylcarbamoyl transferase component Bud32
MELEALPAHGRTAIAGRVLFRTASGVYRDIDAKGIGYLRLALRKSENAVKDRMEVLPPAPKIQLDDMGIYGILNKNEADIEIKNATAFIKAGIRTALPVAEIELHQLVDEKGQHISIEEAQKRGMLNPENQRPVILLRAFGTKLRIENIHGAETKEEAKAMIDDAKNILSRELGRQIAEKTYVWWFAVNLGKQMARMHKKGWVHGYLHDHNITLDCRIIDLDEAKKSFSKEERETDFEQARQALLFFANGCKKAGVNIDADKMLGIFERKYKKELGSG